MALRKALLVGINAYPGAPLRGCLNDVTQMRELLQSCFGFQDADFKLVLDQDATLEGIKAGLGWLAQGGSDPDAVRIFHYSGHGSFVADQNGDEADGKDECLVPVDYQTAGFLIDDELKKLYDTFPRTGNLTLIMDSCHSGDVQKVLEEDIVFRFLPQSDEEYRKADEAAAKFREDQQEFVFKGIKEAAAQNLSDAELRSKVSSLMTKFEKARFGDIRVREANVLLAGCRSDQTSADAFIGGDYHGAFTYYLASTLKGANGQMTYRELATKTGGLLGQNKYLQVPQLEYAKKRDMLPVFKPYQ
jgi:metacaspase-1